MVVFFSFLKNVLAFCNGDYLEEPIFTFPPKFTADFWSLLVCLCPSFFGIGYEDVGSLPSLLPLAVEQRAESPSLLKGEGGQLPLNDTLNTSAPQTQNEIREQIQTNIYNHKVIILPS